MKTIAFYFLAFWGWFAAIDILPHNWLMYIIWIMILVVIAKALDDAYNSWKLERQWQALERYIVEDYCETGDTIMKSQRSPINLNPTEGHKN